MAQYNSLRAIARVNNLYVIEALHRELKIDWPDIIQYKNLCAEMFKTVPNMNRVRDYKKVNWVNHSRTLRSTQNAELKIARTEPKLDMNIFVGGPRARLSPQTAIDKIELLTGFKSAVKKYEGFIHVR